MKKFQRKLKDNEGITLIALVVTIIILLILAGVAINMALGDNGLFKRSKEAVNAWKSAEKNEVDILDSLGKEWNKITGNITTIGELYDNYGDDLIGRKLTYSSNGQNNWIIFGRDKDGNVLLTTETPATGPEIKGTAEGWLNYETDLNTACSLYGTTIQGKEIKARSMNMEDVNYVTGFSKLPEPEWDTYTFGADMDYENKKVDYYYPKLGVTTDGNENWMKVKKTESGELVGEEAQFPSNAYIYGTHSMSPGNIFYTNAKGVEDQDITSSINLDKWKYVVGDSGDMLYTLASRSVEVIGNCALFCFGFVGDGSVFAAGDGGLCCSRSDGVIGSDCGAVPVRPVVVLPSDIQVEKIADFYDIVYGEIKTIGELYNRYGDELIGKKLTYSSNGQSNWIIFGRDKDGNVLLTTEAPIEDGYTVRGTAEGWLNYEKELNEVCSTYGATIQEKEITSRSINIDDVNYVTGFNKLPVPEWDIYTFGEEQDYENKKVHYYYPKLGVTTNGHENWMRVEYDEEGNLVGEEAQIRNNSYFYIAGDMTKGNAAKIANNRKIETIKSTKVASIEKCIKFAEVVTQIKGRVLYTDAKVEEVDITELINLDKLKYVVGDNNNLSYALASRSATIRTRDVRFYAGLVSYGLVFVGGTGAFRSPLCDSDVAGAYRR